MAHGEIPIITVTAHSVDERLLDINDMISYLMCCVSKHYELYLGIQQQCQMPYHVIIIVSGCEKILKSDRNEHNRRDQYSGLETKTGN